MIWDFKYFLSLVHFIKKCNISLQENIPSSQDYQPSKFPDMTSKSGIYTLETKEIYFAIPGLMSYPVTLRPDNPVKMEYFLLKIYCISS